MTERPRRQSADRTLLQQIIAGLDDGVIIVNLDQTIAWANRAAMVMHGVRSQKELGATLDDYRKRFELHDRDRQKLPPGRSPLDKVVRGEAFAEVTVWVAPSGEAPRWAHQIRCLVLTDPDGEPDCLALVINDVTEQVSAEERFEHTFAANPAPAVICRLSDLRFVKVNEGFLQMTGYRPEQVLGRSVYELDVLEAAERREQAVEHLRRGETIRQREGRLPLPDGRRKFVIVAGHPIDIGSKPCMLFTFVDLDGRKQAEEQFVKAFSLAPSPMAVIAVEKFRVLNVNATFLARTGWSKHEVIGHTVDELRLWEHSDARLTVERHLARDGKMHSVEVKLRAKDGQLIEHLLSAETVTIGDEHCVLAVMQDISERKRTESELMAAIEAVMQDASWFGQRIVEKLASLAHVERTGGSGAALADLSEREREVLSLVAQGRNDAEVADRLAVSRNTVRNHVSSIYRKIGVHGRGAAVVWARERGLVNDGVGSAARPRRRRPK